jgi:hypothetical protein
MDSVNAILPVVLAFRALSPQIEPAEAATAVVPQTAGA